MYTPAYNREDDPATLAAFMQAHPFATLVTASGSGLIASHIPVVTRLEGETVTLSGHLARANDHWQAFSGSEETLVIFTGPHAYVSPSHYAKHESVPTWNYVAVHAYGHPETVRFENAPERMTMLMADLIGEHEAEYQAQWDSLSEKFRHGMMRGIVGFEMKVTRLEGKYKLSQNRSHEDQREVAQALLSHSATEVAETGRLMEERLEAGETR